MTFLAATKRFSGEKSRAAMLGDEEAESGDLEAALECALRADADLRARLAERFTLTDLAERTGGPARYVKLEETGQKIGFITRENVLRIPFSAMTVQS